MWFRIPSCGRRASTRIVNYSLSLAPITHPSTTTITPTNTTMRFKRDQRRRTNAVVGVLILGSVISLLPALFWETIGFGSLRAQSIVIFKGWLILVPLFFVFAAGRALALEIKEGLSTESWQSKSISLVQIVGYGCALVFALSLEWTLIATLVGKNPPELADKATVLSVNLLAILFMIAGSLATAAVGVYGFRLAGRLLRQKEYFLASLLAVVCLLAAFGLALFGYLELWPR